MDKKVPALLMQRSRIILCAQKFSKIQFEKSGFANFCEPLTLAGPPRPGGRDLRPRRLLARGPRARGRAGRARRRPPRGDRRLAVG